MFSVSWTSTNDIYLDSIYYLKLAHIANFHKVFSTNSSV